MLKIKEIREVRRLSQNEMVELTGIPKRSYINYENEITDVPFQKLQNIASALKVEVQDLVERKGENVVSEPEEPYSYEKETTLLAVRDDIKNDLKEMTAGFMQNFETISEGVVQTLKGQQKILRFIDKLDAEDIAQSGNKLKEFLEEYK